MSSPLTTIFENTPETIEIDYRQFERKARALRSQAVQEFFRPKKQARKKAAADANPLALA
jgi:hypothetical protein